MRRQTFSYAGKERCVTVAVDNDREEMHHGASLEPHSAGLTVLTFPLFGCDLSLAVAVMRTILRDRKQPLRSLDALASDRNTL